MPASVGWEVFINLGGYMFLVGTGILFYVEDFKYSL